MAEINRWRGRAVPLSNTQLYFKEYKQPLVQATYNFAANFRDTLPYELLSCRVIGPLGPVDVTSQFQTSDFTRSVSSWLPKPGVKGRIVALIKSIVLGQYASEAYMAPRCGNPVTCITMTGEDTMGDVSSGSRPTGDNIVINPCEKVKITFTAEAGNASNVPNTPKLIFGSIGTAGNFSRYAVSLGTQVPAQTIGGDTGCPLDLYLDVLSELRSPNFGDASPVLSQAYEKAHGNAMELLVTIIEGGKTGAYISSKMMSIARLCVAVKKRALKNLLSSRKSSPIKAAKATADTWLQFRYAVMPLVLDVQNAIKASNSSWVLAKIIRGFAKAESESSTAVTAARTYYGRSCVLSLSGPVTIVEKAVAYGKLRAMDNHASTRFNRIFGGTQLFSTAWELVPWSFVIDWFMDVGTYLKNLTPLTGYTFAGYSKTLINHKSLQGQVTIGSGANERALKVTCTVSLYQRRPIWGSNKVSLTAQNGLNPTRIADAISLIVKRVL